MPPPERISFVRDFTFLREVEASTRAAPSRHAVGHFRVSRVSLDGLRERKDSSWSNRWGVQRKKNLKKADMASRNIVIKKQYTLL